jgi:hypothetical protein
MAPDPPSAAGHAGGSTVDVTPARYGEISHWQQRAGDVLGFEPHNGTACEESP